MPADRELVCAKKFVLWCRLEQWARITQCGVKNMYVCHGQGVEQPLVSFSADVTALRVAADVMSGEFTVAHDRVKLVDVMVQLYPQLQTLPCHISEGHGDANNDQLGAAPSLTSRCRSRGSTSTPKPTCPPPPLWPRKR